VDLARESATVDSSITTENVRTPSEDRACSSQRHEDAAAASVTASLINHENKTNPPDVEMSVNSSGTNTDPVSRIHMSDNCESVPCQLRCDIDSKNPDVHQTEADSGQLGEDANDSDDKPVVNQKEVHNGQLDENANDSDNAHISLLPGPYSSTQNDSLYKDAEPVDLCKLGSALWPKNTMSADDSHQSFTALAAEHESYCRENAANVTSHAAFHSSCDGDAEVVRDDREVLWPIVSRWLKESGEQWAKQLPRCSELIRGQISESDKKLHVNNNGGTSPPKRTAGDDKNAVNLTPVSPEMNAEPASSSDNKIASIPCDISAMRLGFESEYTDPPPSPALLSREKILSLQFSGVPLSPEVISRIKELRLKRVDGMSRPLDGKRVARNSPASKRVESNSSGIAVLQAMSASTEMPVDSASAENTYGNQSVNHTDVKPDVTLVSADATAGSDETKTQNYTLIPSSSELGHTDVVSGKTGASIQQSETLQFRNPVISYFYPDSNMSADTAVSDVTSGAKKPISSFHFTAQGPLKTRSTDDVRASSSAISPSISLSTATEEVSAKIHPQCVPSIKKSELSTRATSSAVSEKPPNKEDSNRRVNGIPEMPAEFGYHEDLVSPQAQQQIRQSKHSATSRNPRREMDERFPAKERRHRSRKDFWSNEGSAYCPDDGLDPQSRGECQCSKCSRRRNVKNNSTYDQTRSRAQHRSHTSTHDRSSNTFDHYTGYGPYFMPTVTPSFLASVSYSSYCLGAYNAHVHSMQYYNMLSQQATSDAWQQQDNYIRRMAKFHARS